MQAKLLPAAFLDRLTDVLKAMGHTYRLRILELLDLRGPAPAHDVLATLGGAQGALSQHLARLRRTGVIQAERRGKEVWYTLAAPTAEAILNFMRERMPQGAKPPRSNRRS